MAADIFDPYDDHPDVVAVPVAQAIKDFQDHWGPVRAQQMRVLRAKLEAGTSTSEERMAQIEFNRRREERIQLQLFRSLMAAAGEA